jgi:hypothetical protein
MVSTSKWSNKAILNCFLSDLSRSLGISKLQDFLEIYVISKFEPAMNVLVVCILENFVSGLIMVKSKFTVHSAL